MANFFSRYTVISVVLMWMCFASTSVCAESVVQPKVYRVELGFLAGAAYYMGELAPYAFTSISESYGLQVRCKIDQRWALQVKGLRQRVINEIKSENAWDLKSGRYCTPMWHFDATGEYNFFRFGLDQYDIRMRSITPYISTGIGFTAYNQYANDTLGYPMWQVKGDRLKYALYIPVGIGMKWKFAERWQLQVAWQHQLYITNRGDGLEGIVDASRPDILANSYEMNGPNVLNNDVTSTLTVGIVFEFAPDKKICPYCNE